MEPAMPLRSEFDAEAAVDSSVYLVANIYIYIYIVYTYTDTHTVYIYTYIYCVVLTGMPTLKELPVTEIPCGI